jgi:putative endonuclease
LQEPDKQAKRTQWRKKSIYKYTKGLRPWEIVYSEKFPDWSAARAKEKYYKSGVGKEELRRKLVP